MNPWTAFLLRYLLTGTLGTLVIVHAMPRIRESTFAPDQPAAPEGANARFTQRVAARISAAIPRRPSAKRMFKRPREQAPSNDASPSSPGGQTNAPVQDGPRWGVVSNAKTSYYDTKGKYLGRLDPGTFVKIEDVKQNNETLLAICSQIEDPNHATILVPAANLDIHFGAVEELSYELQQLYAERARISHEIQSRDEHRKQSVRVDNPFAAAYVTARDQYNDYWSKVKDLQAKMEALEGPDRMYCVNELRRLKGQDTTLGVNYENARKQYDEWNRKNPPDASLSEAPDLLAEEMERIEAHIEELASPR